MYIYSTKEREQSKYACPDVEVFYEKEDGWTQDDDGADMPKGWYYQACMPGCLPDGSPMGPYDSEEDAIEAAREWFDYEGVES